MHDNAQAVQCLRAETRDLNLQITEMHEDRIHLKKELKAVVDYVSVLE